MVFAQLQHWIYLIIMYHVWKTLIDNEGVTNFSLNEIMTYYGIMRIIWMFTNPFDFKYATRLIKTGALNKLLIKPVQPLLYIISNQLGETLAFGLVNIIFVMFFWMLFGIKIILPSNLLVFLTFLITLILGRLAVILFNLTASSIAFWVTEARHIYLIITNLNRLFGGGFIPLFMLPPVLAAIGKYLPFKYAISFPVNLFLGKVEVHEITMSLGILIVWIGIFAFLNNIFWKKGLKLYEAIGS